jgi:endoglucanase
MAVENAGYLDNPAREVAQLKLVVDAAIASGIYVIVDWHDHNAQDHLDRSKAFFDEFVSAYANVPNIIYEIYNEPVGVSWSTVKTYATSVVGVIRARGAKNVIVVGTPNWSQDVDVAADDPLADTNVAYTLHFYAGSHKAPYRAKALVAINKHLPLFVTEWGTTDASGNGGNDLVESQTWLTFLAQHQISWCNWSMFDKDESASALKPGASTSGPWPASELTTSGAFVSAAIASP